MSAVESALDVLSRAATMVQEERPKVTNLHRKPSSAWRKERRRDPIQSEALDMSAGRTNHHHNRPSVIVPTTPQVGITIEDTAMTPTPTTTPTAASGGQRTGIRTAGGVSDPAIDEHFKRSLGPKKYAAVFNATTTDKETGLSEREVWYEAATRAIETRIREAASTSVSGTTPPAGMARGVVLFVGDGMGMSTLTAARIFAGQRHGNPGEETQLAWESFPAVALARTYNMDAQVGESSACATALLCGVKANYETVGLDSSARFEDCNSSFEARVPSLINWAQDQGKSTGLVTTTRVTHATPAALYAHAASRYWEDDGKVPPAARTSCKDIARQLLEDEPGCNITVILGGGRRHFVPKVTLDPEEPDKEGRRLDGRNLIEEWSRNHRKRNIAAKYVANKEQFEKVDTRRVNRLLGLFAYSHMDFDVDRNTNDTGDPSLAEMAIKALRILANNPEGYFLFVEGGRIDHAHHYNNAYRALDETLALEEAVEAVMKEVDLTETLLVVTADHSHVLTLGGLATHRGNPIFGSDSKVSDVDGQPYTTLLYSNGPGYMHPRNILREAGKDSIQTAGVPRAWATHGGEDVPVFAVGPLASALFSGSVDQSYIPHAIAYAACLAHHASRCSRDSTNNANANDTMNAAPISCPSAEPNSAAISSDVMNDRMRNPPTKSAAGPRRSPVGGPSLLLTLLLLSPLMPLMPVVLLILRCPIERTS